MRFSICIPNYNYGRYLGQTIKSVLDQKGVELELLIADNASTDDSVDVIKSFADARIRLTINPTNVGFAGNLDRVGAMATGDYMIMLSSDDLMQPGSLQMYQKLLTELGPEAAQTVVSSTWDVIDSHGLKTKTQGPDKRFWFEQDRDTTLEQVTDAALYKVKALELLKRCLNQLKNPFNFAATCYPRALYERVGGYGGNRLVNPDKWFHWKLLSVASTACFLDSPLFCYRWHPSNQTALELNSASLKFLVDEYASTLELDSDVLERTGLTRDAFIRAFLENDVINHGLATLARRNRRRAARILRFGEAVYPEQLAALRRTWILRCLLWTGPIGEWIARLTYSWQTSQAAKATLM
jgi:glycosyltransferase involved in cell wall biosynthesis